MAAIAIPRQCVSPIAPRSCRRKVLLVGAERPDEFAYAMRLACQGHAVAVVNPRETAAARAYRNGGGRFIQARIEDLPLRFGPFHVICENYPYPYPLALGYDRTKAFAWARLERLAIGGRWVVFSESGRLATTLADVTRHEAAVRSGFRLRFSELSSALAPHSAYPRRKNRYRLIFQRVR
jgi:hypothetical protein